MSQKYTIQTASIEEVHSIFIRIPEFENPYKIEELYKRLFDKPNSILVAKYENEIVGFKVGYHYGEKKFYSWLGGIMPKHRRQGLAKQLAIRQEDWLIKNGYEELWMKTRNEHRNMLHFAVKNGFNFVEVKKMKDIRKNKIWLKKGLKSK